MNIALVVSDDFDRNRQCHAVGGLRVALIAQFAEVLADFEDFRFDVLQIGKLRIDLSVDLVEDFFIHCDSLSYLSDYSLCE